MLCGNVPAGLPLPDKTMVLGAVAFADFLDLVGNARTLVNGRTPFRDGAHERVFYAMSRGTAVLTDGEIDAGDGRVLRLASYWLPGASLRDGLDALARRNAATGPAELEAEREQYMARHSWTARMTGALAFMAQEGLFAG